MRRRPIFPFVVVFILALLVTYVGDHLIPDAWPVAARLASWAGVASLVALPFVGMFLLRTRSFGLALAPLGLSIFLLTFTVIRDLLWLVARWFAPGDVFELSSAAPANAFKLLLAHQPASAVEGAAAGFQLQLSGHTHGGQFFPGTLFAHLVFPFVRGLARVASSAVNGGSMWIYTSSGTGFVGAPLRTVASEITRLRLKRA